MHSGTPPGITSVNSTSVASSGRDTIRSISCALLRHCVPSTAVITAPNSIPAFSAVEPSVKPTIVQSSSTSIPTLPCSSSGTTTLISVPSGGSYSTSGSRSTSSSKSSDGGAGGKSSSSDGGAGGTSSSSAGGGGASSPFFVPPFFPPFFPPPFFFFLNMAAGQSRDRLPQTIFCARLLPRAVLPHCSAIHVAAIIWTYHHDGRNPAAAALYLVAGGPCAI